MTYIVVRNIHLNKLIDDVNEKLKEGYILIGGVATVGTSDVDEFFQAMSKKNTFF